MTSVSDVRGIREATGLDQAGFANAFGIAIGTLRDWEQHRRRPEGAARTLLQLIETDPEWVRAALNPTKKAPPPAPPARQDALTKYLAQWHEHGLPMDVDAFVFRASITLIAITIDREFRQSARAVGITPGELRVLLALRRTAAPHALRPADLLRQLLVSSSAISKQLARLEQRRLIRRINGPDDESQRLVTLTEKGFRLGTTALTRRETYYRVSGGAFSRLSEADRTAGVRFLRAVLAEIRAASAKVRSRDSAY